VRRYVPIAGVQVVGLCGHARHGKDETAKLLLRLWPGAERFAFSDALSAICRVAHGMVTRNPAMLQEVGMMYRDNQQGVWLDALYGAIEDRQPALAIITGVRFPDEAQMVRSMGGSLVRVVRNEPDGTPFLTGDRDTRHRAEAAIDILRVDDEIVARSGDMAGLDRAVRVWLAGQPWAA
jgi:hypothetical protein